MPAGSCSRLDTLARTAWWTAAARACETRRCDRLFDDPWAALLAGTQSVEAFYRTVAHPEIGTVDLYAIITRFFDDFLLRVNGIDAIRQIVLVASGLDARAFRLPWQPDTHVFELDQPHVIAYKRHRFAQLGATPGCTWHPVGVDLNEPWWDVLRAAGFASKRRSAWLLEGFLYFLSEPAARRLLQAITACAAPGSWLGVDIVNGAMLTSPVTRHWNERMSAAGAPWLFTSEEPEALLAEFGWSAGIVQPGEDGANFGRHFPATPRSVSGVPRSLLAIASRV